MSSRSKFAVLLVSSVIVVYAVVGGMMEGVSAQDGTYRYLSILTEVIERIENDYVDEPDLTSAMEGAIRGMVESIDPHGGYLSPENVRFYQEFDALEAPGIGAILGRKFDYPVIVTVIPGGPADRAGLGTGDAIEAVNGESLREHNIVEVEELLTGPAGSTVDIHVIRRNSAMAETLTLSREVVKLPPAETRLIQPGMVGYVKIPIIAEGKADEARQQLERLRMEGATALVLDLRSSADGEPDEAIALADLFIESGTLGYIEGQTVEREAFTASENGTVWDLPMAVLINEGTAGAAEVLAAAIRDNDRGEVVGVRSFGHASVQELLPLDNGWALLLAVANYYTPDGDEIPAEGVEPTVEVGQAAGAADPLAVPQAPAEEEEDADRQLERALEILGAGAAGRAAA